MGSAALAKGSSAAGFRERHAVRMCERDDRTIRRLPPSVRPVARSRIDDAVLLLSCTARISPPRQPSKRKNPADERGRRPGTFSAKRVRRAAFLLGYRLKA